MDDPVAAVEGLARPGRIPLDLAVRAGEVVLLSGPNGSGKTSLLRLLAGLSSPLEARAVRPPASVQLLAQHPRDSLVGLTVAGEFRLRRLAPPPLGRLAGREVATLSSGEARRAGLEVVRAARPRLLLLDEPAEGLDASGLAILEGLVRAAAAGGAAVVAADHTGALDAAATRRVALGPQEPAPLDPLPAPGGGPAGPVVVAPPAQVRLGGVRLRLPAVALGPGLHALAGPNGTGKSTLLLRLAGLQSAEGVQVAGRPPRPGRTARLLLPQARHLLTRATVDDELAGGAPSPLAPPALGPRHPLTLSGGEAQRVALAKTLGRPAPLYLLDEPDAHLDGAAWPLLRDAIAARVADGACVVAATHDRRLLALARSVVRLGAP